MSNNFDTAFIYADSIKYGYLKEWYPRSQQIMKIMRLAMPFAREMLDLPRFLTVQIGPLRQPHAIYNHANRRVTIDPRKAKNLGGPLISLCHELVHAEQFNQGRLSLGLRTLRWMGEPIKMEVRNYQKYRAQPWEAEAFERELVLAKDIALKIRDKI